MVEAIIFDMDGVLFDTEKYYYDRRANFLAQKGISIDHLPPSFFIGGNTKQVWENILRDDYDNWDVPTLQEEYNAYKQDNPLPYKELIFPDVFKVLNEVKSRAVSYTHLDVYKRQVQTTIMLITLNCDKVAFFW